MGAGLLLPIVAILLWSRPSAARGVVACAPLIAYLVPLLGLNLALSCERHASAQLLARWILASFLALALGVIGRAGGARTLSAVAAAAGTIAGLVALWQGLVGLSRQAGEAATLEGPLRELVLARLRSGRVFGTFLLPASLGGALAITLPLTVALLLTSNGRASRGVHTASAAVQAAALVWTFSLGSWMALASAAACVLAAPLLVARRGRAWLAGGLTVAILIVGAGWFARRSLLPPPGPEDRPVAYRTGNWSAAAAMIRDHPLFGTGLGTFGHVFPQYRREGMNETRYAHCSWLQLPAELGVAIVPPLLLIPLGAWLLVRRARGSGPLAVAAAVGVVAFLVQNTADFTLYQPSVVCLLVLALAVATASEGGAAGEARVAGEGRLASAAMLAIAILAGTWLVGSGLSNLATGAAMAAHGEDPSRERSRLEAATRLDPFDPEPRSDLASILATQGGPGGLARALGEVRRAVQLDSQTPFRHSDLAWMLSLEGHPGEAWIELSRAASLYPLKTEYRQRLDQAEARLFPRAADHASTAPPRLGEESDLTRGGSSGSGREDAGTQHEPSSGPPEPERRPR